MAEVLMEYPRRVTEIAKVCEENVIATQRYAK
jgi:hypothetical protein